MITCNTKEKLRGEKREEKTVKRLVSLRSKFSASLPSNGKR